MQPRFGATLDGVKRPAGILVPRARQAPDGHKSGGHEPMDISRINRRIDWLRLFPSTKGKQHHENLKKLLPTLDIGSHINARHQARRAVGASHKSTLYTVAWMPWLGQD
jgi:hypothetical protein